MTKNRTNTIYRISERRNAPLYLEFAEEEAKLIRDGNVIFTKASMFKLVLKYLTNNRTVIGLGFRMI